MYMQSNALDLNKNMAANFHDLNASFQKRIKNTSLPLWATNTM